MGTNNKRKKSTSWYNTFVVYLCGTQPNTITPLDLSLISYMDSSKTDSGFKHGLTKFRHRLIQIQASTDP